MTYTRFLGHLGWGRPLAAAAVCGTALLPIAALARTSWAPVWVGYGLITSTLSLTFGCAVLALFIFLARPAPWQAITMALLSTALVPLALAAAADSPSPVGPAITGAGVLTFGLIAGGLGFGLVQLVGRIVVALADRALARHGRPSINETIDSTLAGLAPQERAVVVAAGMGAAWLLTSWMFSVGDAADNVPMRLVQGLLRWLVPIGDTLAVTAIGGGMLLWLVSAARAGSTTSVASERVQATVAADRTGPREELRTDQAEEEPPWLQRLRLAARPRPRTQHVQIRWHDLEQLLQRHDLLMEVSRPEHQHLARSLSDTTS